MSKNITLLFIIFFINFISSQNLVLNDQMCVINILGSKVYEKPTFDSQVLIELLVGHMLIVEKSIETKEKFKIGDNFSLSGSWIKPKGLNGYVFSSDLSNKEAKIDLNEFGQIKVNLLGKLLSEKSGERQVKTENGAYPEYFEFKYYENGTYNYKSFDGCFDHNVQYKNLILSEVYHQMVSDYYGLMGDSKTWIPIFIVKEGNTIEFEGEGATQDLKIEIKENGIFIVSSYDCT